MKPELKRVLVNEPTRYLGPHGAAGSLFSKKDLQKTIAEQLFNDGTYDLSDQTIMENLTRAVKNKLHKYVPILIAWPDSDSLCLCSSQNSDAL